VVVLTKLTNNELGLRSVVESISIFIHFSKLMIWLY